MSELSSGGFEFRAPAPAVRTAFQMRFQLAKAPAREFAVGGPKEFLIRNVSIVAPHIDLPFVGMTETRKSSCKAERDASQRDSQDFADFAIPQALGPEVQTLPILFRQGANYG
jgi:hypothetical protein